MFVQLLRAPRPVEEGPLELDDLPVPEPGPGRIRIWVKARGACRTDLHTVEGELELPLLPVIPGHHVAGVVDALGEGAAGSWPSGRAGSATDAVPAP